MARVKKILTQEILNCVGIPTVEATVILDSGSVGIASFPTGEGGIYDALELKDRDAKRFGGHGVLRAVGNVLNLITPSLIGQDALDQQQIDKRMIELDGTPHKSNLGANAIFAVSMAVAKAGSKSTHLPLYLYLSQFLPKNHSLFIPTPLFDAEFSEFMIVPAFSKRLEESLQVFNSINKSLKKLSGSKNFIENTSIKLGFDFFLGLDSQNANFYEKLNEKENILYIEDPSLPAKFPKETIIAGDDQTATNLHRLQMALTKKIINAIVIKPFQAGTVIEALAIAHAAKEMGLKTIVSHRSNEADDFISDFAVAASADYVKLGSPTRGENISKYNRLLQIENQLKVI